MLLTDVWLMDRFLLRHPPTDILVAGYLSYKKPRESSKAKRGPQPSLVEAARQNSQSFPMQALGGKLAPMPERLKKIPAMRRVIEEMRAKQNGG